MGFLGILGIFCDYFGFLKVFLAFFEIFGTVIWIGALYQAPELEGDRIICQKTEFFFI